MRTHSLRFAALAVALLSIGAALQAQDQPQGPPTTPGMGPGMGRGMGHGEGRGVGRGEGRGLKGLNLTEAQQAQVKAIHDRHQATLKAKVEAANTARQALHEAMAKTATDTKTLQALHEKVSAAQFDLMLEHRALRQEILPVLTAEQKAQFEQHPMGPGSGSGMRHPGMRGHRPGFGPGIGPGPRPQAPADQPS